MTTATSEMFHGRSLISDKLFTRLATRVAAEEHVEPPYAERIVDQALAFLAACAANPGADLSPSETVDAGWHAFMLHSREYARFCDGLAGRFIHHVPIEGAGSTCGQCHEDGNCAASGADGNENTDTRTNRSLDAPAAMEAAGYVVDSELWAPCPQDA